MFLLAASDSRNLIVVLSVAYVLTSSGSKCLCLIIVSPRAAQRALYALISPVGLLLYL